MLLIHQVPCSYGSCVAWIHIKSLADWHTRSTWTLLLCWRKGLSGKWFSPSTVWLYEYSWPSCHLVLSLLICAWEMKPRKKRLQFPLSSPVLAAHLDPDWLGCLTGRVIGWGLGELVRANNDHLHYVRAYRELQAESNDQQSR